MKLYTYITAKVRLSIHNYCSQDLADFGLRTDTCLEFEIKTSSV